MSDEDEELVVAEKATTLEAPSLLVGLAVAGIILAIFKLGSYAIALPWLIYPRMLQGNADPNAPAVLVEYQRLIVDIQGKYMPYQLILFPLGLLVAGLLLWASLKAYKLRPQGDFWMKSVMIAAIVVDLFATVILVLMQIDNYHALQIAIENFEPEDNAAKIVQVAMNVGFYIGAAAALGFLLLQFGYYLVTFRYFSKPEVHALYKELAPSEAPSDV